MSQPLGSAGDPRGLGPHARRPAQVVFRVVSELLRGSAGGAVASRDFRSPLICTARWEIGVLRAGAW